MLSTIKDLKGYTLESLDGEIGKVKEFYFDDHYWTIRYLVADTGSWLSGKKVLLSPYALSSINKNVHSISVDLSKAQIQNSPSIDTDLPVSKQFEEDYYGYYNWPYYGQGSNMWGWRTDLVRGRDEWKESSFNNSTWDPNLRSTRAVTGYHIETLDGPLGHVSDFIVDDHNWSIRYLIVETNEWFGSKKVLISPEWFERVSWSDSTVYLDVTRDAVKSSPAFTDDALINRDYESGLYGHYDRRGYWVDDLVA